MHNISQASTPDELNGVRRLMRDFVAWHKTRHAQYRDLIDKYFGAGAFEAELDNLPGHYAPPRGRLLIAKDGPQVVGCVALHELGDGICEMKRMFVASTHRGQGIGCDQVHVIRKPRLLSDNGFSYVSGDLAEWLNDKGMNHSRGAPYHPQTQGKIERWHQTLKNRILLENYFLPGDLKLHIKAFADHYNHQRYHKSLTNVTPSDVYFGRAQAILKQRERLKRKTLETRRLHHRNIAAQYYQPDESDTHSIYAASGTKTYDDGHTL